MKLGLRSIIITIVITFAAILFMIILFFKRKSQSKKQLKEIEKQVIELQNGGAPLLIACMFTFNNGYVLILYDRILGVFVVVYKFGGLSKSKANSNGEYDKYAEMRTHYTKKDIDSLKTIKDTIGYMIETDSDLIGHRYQITDLYFIHAGTPTFIAYVGNDFNWSITCPDIDRDLPSLKDGSERMPPKSIPPLKLDRPWVIDKNTEIKDADLCIFLQNVSVNYVYNISGRHNVGDFIRGDRSNWTQYWKQNKMTKFSEKIKKFFNNQSKALEECIGHVATMNHAIKSRDISLQNLHSNLRNFIQGYIDEYNKQSQLTEKNIIELDKLENVIKDFVEVIDENHVQYNEVMELDDIIDSFLKLPDSILLKFTKFYLEPLLSLGDIHTQLIIIQHICSNMEHYELEYNGRKRIFQNIEGFTYILKYHDDDENEDRILENRNQQVINLYLAMKKIILLSEIKIRPAEHIYLVNNLINDAEYSYNSIIDIDLNFLVNYYSKDIENKFSSSYFENPLPTIVDGEEYYFVDFINYLNEIHKVIELNDSNLEHFSPDNDDTYRLLIDHLDGMYVNIDSITDKLSDCLYPVVYTNLIYIIVIQTLVDKYNENIDISGIRSYILNYMRDEKGVILNNERMVHSVYNYIAPSDVPEPLLYNDIYALKSVCNDIPDDLINTLTDNARRTSGIKTKLKDLFDKLREKVKYASDKNSFVKTIDDIKAEMNKVLDITNISDIKASYFWGYGNNEEVVKAVFSYKPDINNLFDTIIQDSVNGIEKFIKTIFTDETLLIKVEAEDEPISEIPPELSFNWAPYISTGKSRINKVTKSKKFTIILRDSKALQSGGGGDNDKKNNFSKLPKKIDTGKSFSTFSKLPLDFSRSHNLKRPLIDTQLSYFNFERDILKDIFRPDPKTVIVQIFPSREYILMYNDETNLLFQEHPNENMIPGDYYYKIVSYNQYDIFKYNNEFATELGRNSDEYIGNQPSNFFDTLITILDLFDINIDIWQYYVDNIIEHMLNYDIDNDIIIYLHSLILLPDSKLYVDTYNFLVNKLYVILNILTGNDKYDDILTSIDNDCDDSNQKYIAVHTIIFLLEIEIYYMYDDFDNEFNSYHFKSIIDWYMPLYENYAENANLRNTSPDNKYINDAIEVFNTCDNGKNILKFITREAKCILENKDNILENNVNDYIHIQIFCEMILIAFLANDDDPVSVIGEPNTKWNDELTVDENILNFIYLEIDDITVEIISKELLIDIYISFENILRGDEIVYCQFCVIRSLLFSISDTIINTFIKFNEMASDGFDESFIYNIMAYICNKKGISTRDDPLNVLDGFLVILNEYDDEYDKKYFETFFSSVIDYAVNLDKPQYSNKSNTHVSDSVAEEYIPYKQYKVNSY